MTATAISIYHRGADASEFLAWAQRLGQQAGSAPGHLESRVGAMAESGVDWATAVTFANEEALHLWLDSAQRSQLLADGAALGFPRSSTDVVVVDGKTSASGVGVFQHAVTPGKGAQFIASQLELVELSASFPGFEGAAVIGPGPLSELNPASGTNPEHRSAELTPPSGGGVTGAASETIRTKPPLAGFHGSPAAEPDAVSDQWLSVLRFRTDHQLQAWIDSRERRQALPRLRSQLSEEFSVVTDSAPFGSILRVQDGTTRVTPEWKTAMLVLMVLYPTVMTLSRFLGPVLDGIGADPWLSMWLSQIVSVGAMTWMLMPMVTRWFRRWLDPVDGSTVRISVIGAGVVAVIYVLTLALFGSVKWLQFWDYLD